MTVVVVAYFLSGEKMKKNRVDFEVIGLDTNGLLICRDILTGEKYNCGETLKEFGVNNLTEQEKMLFLPRQDAIQYGIYSKDIGGGWLKFISNDFPAGLFQGLRDAKSYGTREEAETDLTKILVEWEKGRGFLSVEPIPDRSHLQTFIMDYKTFFITKNVFEKGKYCAERRFGMGKHGLTNDVYLHDDTEEGVKKRVDDFFATNQDLYREYVKEEPTAPTTVTETISIGQSLRQMVSKLFS